VDTARTLPSNIVLHQPEFHVCFGQQQGMHALFGIDVHCLVRAAARGDKTCSPRRLLGGYWGATCLTLLKLRGCVRHELWHGCAGTRPCVVGTLVWSKMVQGTFKPAPAAAALQKTASIRLVHHLVHVHLLLSLRHASALPHPAARLLRHHPPLLLQLLLLRLPSLLCLYVRTRATAKRPSKPRGACPRPIFASFLP